MSIFRPAGPSTTKPFGPNDQYLDRAERRWCTAHRARCLAAGGGYFTTSPLRRTWLCADALAKRAKPA